MVVEAGWKFGVCQFTLARVYGADRRIRRGAGVLGRNDPSGGRRPAHGAVARIDDVRQDVRVAGPLAPRRRWILPMVYLPRSTGSRPRPPDRAMAGGGHRPSR